MRVRLETIGCRLNIGEIEAMARQLAAAGHRVVGPGEGAELCIVNSCTVTAEASRKSRQLIRQLRRGFPDATVVATGCYSELAPEQTRGLGADLVVGNDDKDRLTDILEERGLMQSAEHQPVSESTPFQVSRRTRAFLKVQDGCDNRCAFCIVTVARGAAKSRPLADVVTEAIQLHALGYQEVVLSGVHLGSYGHDLGDRRGLSRLVQTVLADTAMPRVRLSSLEPWDLDEAFFELFSDPRLLPHLHLPLQSGCDATLRRMARRTTREKFVRLVETARREVPDVSISTDVMVGFPGESDAQFAQSIELVEELAFSRLHVFRYSAREGTPAATLPHQVPGPVMHERSRKVHALGAELERRFNGRFVNRRMAVLWETSETAGSGRRWSGLTDNYIRVTAETPPGHDLGNRVTGVHLTHAVPGGLAGRVLGTGG